MRVLYVTGHYPPDFVSGATLQVQRLAEAVQRLGHEVAVLSGAIADPALGDGAVRRDVVNGVAVHWIGTAHRVEQDVDENWQNPHAARLAAELMANWRPDVVHCHALQTLGGEVVGLAADAGATTVVTMHDFWWWCPRLFLVDRQLQPCPPVVHGGGCPCARTAEWREARQRSLAPHLAVADLVLVPSGVMRDAVVANGLAPARVEVDENDLDLPATLERPDHAGDVRFLYVGGDSPLKGAAVLADAVGRLRSVSGWRLSLPGSQQPPRRRWRTRVDPRLTYGPAFGRTEVAAVLADADVLVLPSIARESYSLATREALAAGVAVITSDCLGPLEVVRDGVNGLVVPTGDAAALAAAMRRVIDDRAELATLRAGAAASPRTARTPDEHAAALIERYRRLPGRNGVSGSMSG